VDITTPPIWDGDTVSMVDLDLDVVQTLDGPVLVVDEDEFGKNQVSYWYPQDMITSARTSCDEIAAAMHRRDEPYRSVGRSRLPHTRVDHRKSGLFSAKNAPVADDQFRWRGELGCGREHS